MIQIDKYEIDPFEVLEVSPCGENVFTVVDLVDWVLNNPDAARKLFSHDGVDDAQREFLQSQEVECINFQTPADR